MSREVCSYQKHATDQSLLPCRRRALLRQLVFRGKLTGFNVSKLILACVLLRGLSSRINSFMLLGQLHCLRVEFRIKI